MRRLLLASGLALLAAAVAGGLWFWRHPLDVFHTLSRRALRRAGLEERTLASPAGLQTVFRGGRGPAIVLLHGAGDQAGTWAAVAPRLSARRTLVVPDLAGHGASAPAAGPLPLSAVLAGALAVLDAEAQPRVTLAGNSMGGWVAFLVARARPSRVERIVAVDGGPLRGEPGPSLLPKTRDEARRLMDLLRDPVAPKVPGFVLDDLVRRGPSGPIARLFAAGADLERHLLDARDLASFPAPVDLIWGASDRIVPPDYAERLRAALPHARLSTIEACGHVPQVECPEAFGRTLESVLASAPP